MGISFAQNQDIMSQMFYIHFQSLAYQQSRLSSLGIDSIISIVSLAEPLYLSRLGQGQEYNLDFGSTHHVRIMSLLSPVGSKLQYCSPFIHHPVRQFLSQTVHRRGSDLQWHSLICPLLNTQGEMLDLHQPSPDPRWTLRRNTYIDIPVQAINTKYQINLLVLELTIAESS